VSANTAYAITKHDSVYKIHKIIYNSRNSWTSSSFSGLTEGLISFDIKMGQFDVSASTPYLYYVGNTKNFLGKGGLDYSSEAGFLMKMMAVNGNYESETCGSYSITFNVSDVISTHSSYTRTANQAKITILTSSLSIKSST
jgi:hypothetical protein